MEKSLRVLKANQESENNTEEHKEGMRTTGDTLSRLRGDIAPVHVFKAAAQETYSKYILHILCSFKGEKKNKRL